MKIRTDFVSNSSSSSFIVIADNGNPCIRLCQAWYDNHQQYESFCIPNKEYGCHTFGWENRTYVTFEDKLNWCGIILMDLLIAQLNIELKAGKEGKPARKVNKSYETIKKNFHNWYTMLYKVCKEKFGFTIHLTTYDVDLFGGEDDGNWLMTLTDSYIDHQSNIFENPRNGSMFESEEALYNFLHYENSYIQGGNDNGY